MRIPLNMGVKGRVTAILTNTETGEKQEVKGDNLILNHYLDWAMTQGLGILGSATFDRCYIGTGDTPPQPGDTTFNGTQLAVSSDSTLVKALELEEKFSLIQSDQNITSPTDRGQMDISPDDNILVVGGNNQLKAYKIDKDNWTLDPLTVPAFDNIDFNATGTLSGITCGQEYLFVGMDKSPYGMLFKREENNFTFISNLPSGLADRATASDISFDDKYLIVAYTHSTSLSGDRTSTILYELSPEGPTLIQTFRSRSSGAPMFLPNSHKFVVPSRKRLSGSSDTPVFELWDIIDGTPIRLFQYAHSSSSNSGCEQAIPVGEDVFILILSTTSIYRVQWLGADIFDVKYIGYFPSSSFEPAKIMPSGIACTPDGKAFNTKTFVQYSIGPDVRKGRSVAVMSSQDVVFLLRDVEDRTELGIYEPRKDFKNKNNYSRQWTFPAGVGTGIVNRVGLQANSGTGANGNNRHVAQIVLPEPLEKTDLHQLDIIWEIEVENPGVWEGVIPGGSRDGSDLAWRVTINEDQFFALVPTGYNILANWFGVTGTPNVRIGTSNEESDLVLDRANIKGEEIEYISSTAISEVNPYVPGSLKRTIRLFLEVDQGNGQIGEIVLGGSTSDNSLARITFDPPLDKPPHEGEGANPHRLYIDFTFGWQRGESNA